MEVQHERHQNSQQPYGGANNGAPPTDRNLSDYLADWLEERAAIRQYDGHMACEAADVAAWGDLLAAVVRGENPITVGRLTARAAPSLSIVYLRDSRHTLGLCRRHSHKEGAPRPPGNYTIDRHPHLPARPLSDTCSPRSIPQSPAARPGGIRGYRAPVTNGLENYHDEVRSTVGRLAQEKDPL